MSKTIFYVLIILGIGSLLFPKILWIIGGGFKHDNMEPNINFLVVSRGIGVILVIIAIVYYLSY